MLHKLTEQTISIGLRELISQEQFFQKIVSSYDLPPFWQREQGFATLVQIILEQQVSLASAHFAYTRLQDKCNPLTPEGFIALSDVELKQIGFSRQKISYGRALAHALLAKTLDLTRFEHLSDAAVREQLMGVKGIGIWTANIYLIMALHRADIWPKGDIALQTAIQEIRGLPKRPTSNEAQIMSEAWRPWRSLAARLLWHFYLSKRQQGYP
ncbi:MAG: DNA-3-methyladenine glycosylase 2 family protein [Leptolyngbya sp. SIO3F4]|nr:DNA-3-methyladenine glycosylase 2 family protein [Leptolyngbya sp. SIO3F4]